MFRRASPKQHLDHNKHELPRELPPSKLLAAISAGHQRIEAFLVCTRPVICGLWEAGGDAGRQTVSASQVHVAYARLPGILEASRRIISLPSYPPRRVEIEELREVERDFSETRRLDSDEISGKDRHVTATGHVTPMVLDLWEYLLESVTGCIIHHFVKTGPGDEL
ncbi:hypothetical protein E2C01_071021 [Portunus trituberculatus]|uniref:Uncharacterized protein n=1 Tax=Portunus trituberculatus TaxID=210409 RepID=A0A5B7I715_PORTR|nr:hypothetical protein [Portunus trituberculatus]